jgi:hypothetical protein
MDIEPNDTPVDTGSEDLADFSEEFFGKPKAAEPTPKEDVTPVEDDDPAPEDTPDAPEDKPDEDIGDGEKEPPKKKDRFQERVNQLLERERAANERAAEAQRKLDELAAKQSEPVKAAPAVAKDGPSPEDKNEDGSEKYPLGEFDPGYIRDMARHTIEQEWNERKAKEAEEQTQRQVQEARDQLQEQWVEKLAPITEQHEDFLDKTMELESAFDGLDPQYSDYLVQTIKSLDHGPEVLYYFANNLEEAAKFVKMGPLVATLALGEYNAMFKGQTRKEARTSKAPPPPQVNKGSKTRTTVAPDTDDLDAFEREFFAKKR